MLGDKELSALRRGLESERVEMKPSISQGSSIRRAICAFANDLVGRGETGVLFVGLEDDGGCSGLEITDQIQKTLADWALSGEILPRPDVEVYRKVLDGCEVAVVEVRPGAAPPVRYQGQVYVRVGTTNRRATPEQERRLQERRRGRDLPFDLRPAEGTDIDVLDLEFFAREYLPNAVAPEVLDENQRTREDQLASLRLTTDGRPNHGSILVLGRDPLPWIPGAYLQFLRIDGTELGDPVKDEKSLTGNLPTIMAQMDELLDVHVQVGVDIESGSRERRQPDYPVVALQQLIRNALIHRTYDGSNAPVRVYWFADRVEIQNPGGLYGQVTKENFGQGVTDYRNPLVAEAMCVLGFIQRFGYGIPLACRRLKENGNPPPDFEFQPTYTAVVVQAAA